jgi:hypothetical protein
MHSTKASFAYEGNPPIVGFWEAQEPIVHQLNPPLCEHSLREQANLQLTREGRSFNSPSYFPLAVFGGLISGKHSLTVLFRPPFNTPVTSGGGILLPACPGERRRSGSSQGGDFENSQQTQLLTDSNQTKNDR